MKLNQTIKALILLAIVANSIAMLFPSLRSTFTPYYGSIAKHIVLSGNWTDLVLSGHDWLDKPHLPFWLTAFSYKIFGVTSFAYILPGFIFYLIGLYFTYKLSKFWYSEETALLSVLFTATALHMMLSAADVRAEAYLVGEVMGACYCWLRYDQDGKFKYLIGGALFTALALMTKGIFILITIISGIAMLWIYRGKWKNFISFKWIFALILSFILITPELMALYYQFDLHPDKIVFGHTNVSGIRWFFWDSQFGRFFNTGPIMSTNPSAWHYLYFIHTFLWAYLPWWPMFFVAIWQICSNYTSNCENQDANLFLMTSFCITFILFSATSFQVDHYTNIIFPFASIICAHWFMKMVNTSQVSTKHPIFYIEMLISLLILIIVLLAASLVLDSIWWILLIMLIAAAISFIIYSRGHGWQIKTIVYPSLAMCILFVFAMMVNGVVYSKYDAGYQVALYLNKTTKTPVYGYKIDMLSLDLHSQNQYKLLDNLTEIKTALKPVYIVIPNGLSSEITSQYPSAKEIKIIGGSTIETFLKYIIDPVELDKHLDKYVIMRVE
jgi:4-amino-4-deoxy-L-arabinose transferase-like glycosyltransferase